MIRPAAALLILFSSVLCAAGEIPSPLISFCERLLVDGGILHPPVRARIQEVDGVVTPIGDLLAVTVAGQNNHVRYARTRRNVQDLVRIDPHFPPPFFSLANFKDKKVLDLACGEGRAVEQLRRAGVDVVGLDIHLTPYMLSKPYFIKASAHQTGLPAQSFDIIYTAQGPFTYLSGQPAMMQSLLREAHRLLKTGGVLRISPVTVRPANFLSLGARPEIDLEGTPFADLPPGLRLKSWPDQDWFYYADPREGGHQPHYWLELERVD